MIEYICAKGFLTLCKTFILNQQGKFQIESRGGKQI